MTDADITRRARAALAALVPFEHKIFRQVCGFAEAQPWGAAVGAAMEALQGKGLIDDAWRPATPLGREAQRLLREESPLA